MPPSTSLAVVLEVRENGDRLVWDFSKQQERVFSTSVGQLAEWLRIDAEDVRVTQALTPTSDVDIKQIPGRHIKLTVPAIKLPDIQKDLGIELGVDRTKRFYCPLLGPVDHFSDTSRFPENVWLELDVVKVPAQLKAAIKAKAGYDPEWMFVGQSLQEITRDKEEEFDSLLEQLKRARMCGVAVRSAGTSHVIVSESDDGQRQLFVAQDADVEVGHLISFLPVNASFTAPVQFAASCRVLSQDFLLTVDEDSNQFRVSSAAAVEFTNERYRLARLGWIEDPNGCISSVDGRAENVIFAMDLDLNTAQVTFAACGIVPGASEKVRIIRQQSLESSEESFTDESSSDKGNAKFQSSNGSETVKFQRSNGSGKSASQLYPNAPWLNKPKILEPKEYTLTAVCSMRKGDEVIFKCEAEGFDRSQFTCKIQTFKAAAKAKEPVLGQWYELKLRFFAKKSLDLPRTDISYVKAIDPPEMPYASSRAVRQESPTSSEYATAESSFSRPASSMSTAANQLASVAQKEKDEGPYEYTLSARLTQIKGFEAFFACPAAGFKPQAFIVKTNTFPVAPAPVAGQWYELTLTFSGESLNEQKLPHAFVKLAKSIRKPSTPYYSCRARLPNGSECASPAMSEASRNTTPNPGPQQTNENAPANKEEELVACIIAQVGDNYRLYAPKKHQAPSSAFFFTKKFCFDGLSPALGAWYKLYVKWTNPGYVFVLDIQQMQMPLMPTREEHGRFMIQTRLIPGKPLGGLSCAVSQELGLVADVGRVVGSAFRGRNSSPIDFWCTPRDRTETFSFKASWKVVSLVGSDELSNGMSKLSVQESSVAGPSSSAPKNAVAKKGCRGVVCYKEGDLCYVYSPQLGGEALLAQPPSNIQAGHWLEFNAILGDDKEYLAVDHKEIKAMFTSSPMFRSVVIECEVMVPMRVDDTDRTVSSNFIGGIRDVYGLVSNVDPGVHKATIRYIYEEGSPSGYWQLEYIRVKKAP